MAQIVGVGKAKEKYTPLFYALRNLNNIELFHPVIFGSSTVRLHYARVGDLVDYLDMVAIRGEVIVQFWLRPGDEVVELRFSNEKTSLPAMLENMLLF